MTADVEDLWFEVHPGQGEPLLLVHGFLSSRANWSLNLAGLAEIATPVVVELWGHGRAPGPTDPAAYSAAAYVAAFERVRRAVGCDRWFVCGHSMGAALTLRYALAHAERFRGHVIMNSNAVVAEAEWFVRSAAAFESSAAAFEARGTEAVLDHPQFPGRIRSLPDEVRAEIYADGRLHDPRALAMSLRATSPAVSSRDDVAGNTVPTLLVAGRRERAFAPSLRYLEATMPNLEVVLADAGHAVNLEAHDEFDEHVARFIGT